MEFFGFNFWSRDFLGFDFLPPFDHPFIDSKVNTNVNSEAKIHLRTKINQFKFAQVSMPAGDDTPQGPKPT